MPAGIVEPNVDTPRETTAPAGKTNAGTAPAMKTGRGSKPSRAENGKATHAAAGNADVAQAIAGAATQRPNAETRVAARGESNVETLPTATTAARFARALERAAALTSNEPGSAATAAAATSSGSGQQSPFGDESAERAMQSFTVPRYNSGGVSFTVAAPTTLDVRMLANAVDAATHAVETSPVVIPERDVIAQLVQSLRVQFRDGIGEAVVKLKPEHLGSVQVSLKIENGAIKATVQAEVAAVRQWLESQQDTLRTGLLEQGLRLERFVVERPAVDSEGERQATPDDAQQREQRGRQQHQRRRAAMSGTEQPLFEVTV
jgi:flagellar hook-length control protein FliK